MSNLPRYKTYTKKINIPPAAGLAFAILVTSTSSLFIRFAQQGAPSLAVAALRLSMAALILLPFTIRFFRKEFRYLTRRELTLLLVSGIFLALHFATWISSLAYTTVASSVVLVSTAPMWVVFLSPLVLKEKIPGGIWPGLAVAFAGSALVGLGNSCSLNQGRLACSAFSEIFSGNAFAGNLLAVAGAWFVAGYLLIGRQVRNRLSLSAYISVVYSVAAVVLIILALAFRQPLSGYTPRVYFWCLMLALLPQLMGHSTYNWALRYLPAAYVSISSLGEPVASILMAYFFLRETPGFLELGGGSLILAGIYLVSRVESVSATAPEQKATD